MCFSVLPSSESDSDDDIVEEEASVAVVKEPKVASVLNTVVPPAMVPVEDVKMEITPIAVPTVLKESIQKAFAESIWKPVIDKDVAAPKRSRWIKEWSYIGE
ncbi:unnamed protein product [Cylicostephanus goldi]|uniref:Uncharacterized protein n=1 Tax=Cylicostephanus goldi TaxID=71465 RepID=A0A3P6SM10_CYLGO|nr:unnamed protein product [Cylicostephanus goldi]